MDLRLAAAIPLVPLFEKREPFTLWRSPDQPIPVELETLIQVGVWGYQLFVFLKLIERRFGADVAQALAEEQKAALNRLPDSLGDQLIELLRIIDAGVRAAITGPQTIPGRPDIEVPLEYPIALSLLAQVGGSPYFGHPDPPPSEEKLEFALMACLAYGKQAALRVFEPIVAVMEISADVLARFTTAGMTRAADGLWWSERPGCFERHLQRKHRSPLFRQASDVVSQDQIDVARARDVTERETLRAAVVALAERLALLPSEMTFHEANLLRQEIDTLLERAAELGSSALDEDARLIQLQNAVLRAMRHAGTQKPETKATLVEAERLYRAKVMGSRNSFLAQFTRKDTPILPEEFVPSLLSEDVPTIHAALESLADKETLIEEIRDQARDLAEKYPEKQCPGHRFRRSAARPGRTLTSRSLALPKQVKSP